MATIDHAAAYAEAHAREIAGDMQRIVRQAYQRGADDALSSYQPARTEHYETDVLEELSGLMDTPTWGHITAGIGKILSLSGLAAWQKFEAAAQVAKAEWEAPEEADADERRAARGCEAYHAAKDDALTEDAA